jgi:hypothetical protein
MRSVVLVVQQSEDLVGHIGVAVVGTKDTEVVQQDKG